MIADLHAHKLNTGWSDTERWAITRDDDHEIVGGVERRNGLLTWRVFPEYARPGFKRYGACLSQYDALLQAREVLA